jgi:hypothetical protein
MAGNRIDRANVLHAYLASIGVVNGMRMRLLSRCLTRRPAQTLYGHATPHETRSHSTWPDQRWAWKASITMHTRLPLPTSSRKATLGTRQALGHTEVRRSGATSQLVSPRKPMICTKLISLSPLQVIRSLRHGRENGRSGLVAGEALRCSDLGHGDCPVVAVAGKHGDQYKKDACICYAAIERIEQPEACMLR